MSVNSTHESSVVEALRALRRQLPLLIAIALAVPAVAIGISLLQEKEYTAEASLLFRDPQFDQTFFNSTLLGGNEDPQRTAATNERLVSLDVVADRTAEALQDEDVDVTLTGDQISDRVSVSPEGQADIVSISATARDPELAAQIANTFAAQYIAFRREADRSKIREAQSLVRRELAEASESARLDSESVRSLRRREQQLEILAALQTGNAELVQPAAVPTNPSSPKPVRNGIIGLFLGVLLGAAAALVRDRVDRRMRSHHDVEEIFQRPILGTIRESRGIQGTQSVVGLPRADAEAFRMLRTNLRYFDVDHDVRSVAVTSAESGDGKSTVAIHLGGIAASAGSRVLLIEGDLRHPSIAEKLNLSMTSGLTSALLRGGDFSDAIQKVPVEERVNGSSDLRSLDVLVAGPLAPNPADLLESDAMLELLRNAEEQYDLVVVDTPPTALVSDAIPLVRQVSGVLVVSRLGRSSRDAATRLQLQLENLRVHLLGVVVNSVSPRGPAYYGYGYYGDFAEGSEAPKELVSS